MFVPIHLLPLFNPRERDKYQERWQRADTWDNIEKVVRAIRDYGNEDFLSRECGDLVESGFLESETDLKGFQLQGQQLVLRDEADNFKYTNFKHAQFYNSSFENATFLQAHFDFSRLYKCKFIRCGFHFTSFYAVALEGVEFENCDFAQSTRFHNTDVQDTKFVNCFFQEPVFLDCRFDEDTVIGQAAQDSNRWPAGRLTPNSRHAEMHRAIADAYFAGQAVEQAESALLASARARTKYNTTGWRWLVRLVSGEMLLGYGLRPTRPLLALLAVFGAATAVFAWEIGFSKAAVLAAGAVLTFGAGTDVLSSLPWPYRVIYIASAFIGVSLTALFITSASAYFTSRR